MNKRQKKQSKSKTNSATEYQDQAKASEPLVGREPNHPPRKNVLLLTVGIAAFAIWLGFLIWMALQSRNDQAHEPSHGSSLTYSKPMTVIAKASRGNPHA